jgi:hypothetical protein
MNEGKVVEEWVCVWGRGFCVWFAASSGVDAVVYSTASVIAGSVGYVIRVSDLPELMLARVRTDRLDFERSPRQSYQERSYGHGFFDSKLQFSLCGPPDP